MSDSTKAAASAPAPTYLEAGAKDIVQRIEALKPPKQDFRQALSRNAFLTILAVIVIALVLTLAVYSGPALFGPMERPWQYLVPFGAAFAGVLLYVMGAAREKRADWALEVYFGDYIFRVAQAITYLLIVWWAWDQAVESDATAVSLPPNILGLFVGLFILRVERAVSALGERFEEALNTILPGTMRLDGPERRREHAHASGQVRELEAQWKLLRPKLSDMGARDRVDQAVEAARQLTDERDSERARQAAAELARLFEDVRAGAEGEEWVPLETLLEGGSSR